MRITLETSDDMVELEYEGARVPARVWKGTTEGGVELHAFVLALAVDNAADASEFERELIAIPLPTVQ